MSVKLVLVALEARLPTVEKIVAIKLASHPADDGTNIRPSVPTIARSCGISVRTVQGSLRKLQELGILVLVKEADFGARKPREYRFNIEKLTVAEIQNRCICCTGEYPAPVHITALTGAAAAPKPVIKSKNKKPPLRVGDIQDDQSALNGHENLFPETIAVPANPSIGNGAAEAERRPTPEQELFRRGAEVFGPKSGGLTAKLLKTMGGNVALARGHVEMASTKHDPREYIGRIISSTPEAKSAAERKAELRARGDAW